MRKDKIEITQEIKDLNKEELIEYIRIAHALYGSKFWTSQMNKSYCINFKNEINFKDKLRIIWRVFKYFLTL